MRLRVLLVAAGWVCGGCLLSTAVHAEMDAATFLKRYDEANPATQKYMETRIGDIENGMSWANAVLPNRNQPLIFCPPDSLVLTGEQLVDILRREIKEEPLEGTLGAYPAALIIALEKVFPCHPK